MNSYSTQHLDKPGLFKEARHGKEPKKSQERYIRKIHLRYVTEMLEMYRIMSEKEEKFKQKYEKAAFMVYGTLPKRKVS